MPKTSEVQRAIDRLQAEIRERQSAIRVLQEVQSKMPTRKRKPKAVDAVSHT